MAEAKYFDNLILGQYLLTGVPIDVYVDGRYLTLTDIDDVEDPLFGFGMDVDGKMHEFDYRNIAQLKIGDNIVDLKTYNERMKALQEPAEEEPAEDEEPAEEEPAEEEPAAEEEEPAEEEETTTEESYMPSLKSLLEKAESEAQATAARIALAVKRGKLPKSKLKGASKEMYKMSAKDLEDFTKAKKGAPKKVTEISRDEFKAQEKSYKADIEAAEAKKKSAEEKLKNLKREPIEDSYDPEISAPYVYQVGDMVQNTNTSCPHYGSKGIVKGLMDLDDDMGTVVMYRVTNNGDTFKPGMTLAKTQDQLSPIEDEDDDEF